MGVVQRLGMHVFVQGGELDEVAQALVVRLAREALEGFFQHVAEVDEGRGQARQRQAPARIVRHGRRVVERIRVIQDRGTERFAFLVAQAPVFLEPADVADFPERRIDDRELRPEEALAVERRADAREVIPGREQI